MWLSLVDAYNQSTLEPSRLRAYARKVAAQAILAQVNLIPAGRPDPVCLVALAPANGYRQVLVSRGEEYIQLSHEGVAICVSAEGKLLEFLYSYEKSWLATQPEVLDPKRVAPPSTASDLVFKYLSDERLTYLDYGRDRWHDARAPQSPLISVRSRKELNTRRPVIVPAKGAGLSRALRGLLGLAGGDIRSSRSR